MSSFTPPPPPPFLLFLLLHLLPACCSLFFGSSAGRRRADERGIWRGKESERWKQLNRRLDDCDRSMPLLMPMPVRMPISMLMSVPMPVPVILYSLTTYLRSCLFCLRASSLYTFDESPTVFQSRHRGATTTATIITAITAITATTTTTTVRLALSLFIFLSTSALHLQSIPHHQTHGYSAPSASSHASQENKQQQQQQQQQHCRD